MILYNQLPEELKRDIEKVSKKLDVKAGEIIVNAGDRMDFVPFIMDGSVRVFIENDDVNKELLLYYVEGGQTCMMSMIAGWQIEYEEWNNLILNLFLDRYDDLISTIDELSFKKVEDRLIKYLDNYKDQSGNIKIDKTFKEIARDIASSREVVSRSLKKLQNDNKIKFI